MAISSSTKRGETDSIRRTVVEPLFMDEGQHGDFQAALEHLCSQGRQGEALRKFKPLLHIYVEFMSDTADPRAAQNAFTDIVGVCMTDISRRVPVRTMVHSEEAWHMASSLALTAKQVAWLDGEKVDIGKLPLTELAYVHESPWARQVAENLEKYKESYIFELAQTQRYP